MTGDDSSRRYVERSKPLAKVLHNILRHVRLCIIVCMFRNVCGVSRVAFAWKRFWSVGVLLRNSDGKGTMFYCFRSRTLNRLIVGFCLDVAWSSWNFILFWNWNFFFDWKIMAYVLLESTDRRVLFGCHVINLKFYSILELKLFFDWKIMACVLLESINRTALFGCQMTNSYYFILF